MKKGVTSDKKEQVDQKDKLRLLTEKRKRKAKLYSFHQALRNNVLLSESLKHNQKLINRDTDRNNKLSHHLQATMEVKVRNVERTDEHLNDRLNRCLLFMERGRHMQVVKPYYHGPGKPLTPYQTRRDREAMDEETRREELLEKSKKGVFLRFAEPRRFSAVRDNCRVINLNRFFTSQE